MAAPQLTVPQALEAMNEAMAVLNEDGNKTQLESLLAAAGGDQVKVMQTIPPVVTALTQDVLAKYGFVGPGAIMMAVMQVQILAPQDASGELTRMVQELTAKLQGR